MAYVKIIRPLNLFIAGVLLYTLEYVIIRPSLLSLDLAPKLEHIHFAILTLAILCITAAGYVINDIYDTEIDALNKPHKAFIPSVITMNFAILYYIFLSVAGFILTLCLCIEYKRLLAVLIFFGVTLLMWLYSAKLKKVAFIGNLTVSFVGSLGILTPLLIACHPSNYGLRFHAIIIAFACFAFLTTLYREIVKDIEDVEGDKHLHAKTLPVVSGVEYSKNLALLTGLLLMTSAIIWLIINWKASPFYSHILLFLFVFAPLMFTLYRLKLASDKAEFNQISKWIKFIMFGGIIYLFTL